MKKWLSKHKALIIGLTTGVALVSVIVAIIYSTSDPAVSRSALWFIIATLILGLAGLIVAIIAMLHESTSDPELSEEQDAFNALLKKEKAGLRWPHHGEGTIIVRGSKDIDDWLIEVIGPSSAKLKIEPQGGQLYAAIFRGLKLGSYKVKHPDPFKELFDEVNCERVTLRAGKVEHVDWRTPSQDISLPIQYLL